ncbi:MAG: hypothetical protein Q9166_007181 [cf. Caloplaca sp. 2 TL-2023]
MPIFEDPKQRFPEADQALEASPLLATVKPKTSKESIRTEICDGPLPDAPSGDKLRQQGVQENDGLSHGRGGVCTSDRNELMERIKKGESPTWVPSQTVYELQLREEYSRAHAGEPLPSPSYSARYAPTPLLPSSQLKDEGNEDRHRYAAELSPPSEIKRPRSALHAGDFTKGSKNVPSDSRQSTGPVELAGLPAHSSIGTSPNTPWYSPPQPLQDHHIVSPSPESPISLRLTSISSRSRAPSLNSLSSSYVAKAPTTPLVQQSNNTDLDFSPVDRSMSPSKTNRRHTLPPRPMPCTLERTASNTLAAHVSTARQPYTMRSDSTFPYQTHRPRRSLTTTWSLQASASPQKSSFLSSRRPSFSSEASPLHNASMVGSYEESILRGWMSTAPSKPLNFTAQIGVMGKDSYKPKCPAHVTVPFPAVFYSWSGGASRKHSNIESEPSPYVGHIDLSQLPAPAELKKTRPSRSKSPLARMASSINTQTNADTGGTRSAEQMHRGEKKRRRTSPPPSSPQGGYRIPQKGQLQIVIKNPNKTAVKLFLVPYDLEDMQMGTKTFIRQRCYSTEPVIDGLHSERKAEVNPSLGRTSTKSKPTLRYLIHVNICSPFKGRFYLYQHVRVVFANRVPDNKEQLQTEIQTPQPRYSAYNPSSSLSRSLSHSGSGLAREKAYRRRSSGFGFGHNDLDDRHPQAFSSGISYPFACESPPPTVSGIPFRLSSRNAEMHVTHAFGNDRPGGSGEVSSFPLFGGPPMSPTPAIPFARLPVARQCARGNGIEYQRPTEDEGMDLDSPQPTTSSSQMLQSPLGDKTNLHRLHSKRSDSSHSSGENDMYSKLSRGDMGYGGRPSTPEPAEGLLTKKLRRLGVQRAPPAIRDQQSE